MKRGVASDVEGRFNSYGADVVGKDHQYGRAALKAPAAGLLESVMFFVVNTLMLDGLGKSEWGLHTKEMYVGVRLVLSWVEEYNVMCARKEVQSTTTGSAAK